MTPDYGSRNVRCEESRVSTVKSTYWVSAGRYPSSVTKSGDVGTSVTEEG